MAWPDNLLEEIVEKTPRAGYDEGTKGDFSYMEFVSKLERTILEWLKSVPHLPSTVRKWLGDNAWWIAIIGAVLSGIATLALLGSLFASLSTLASPFISYYASATFVGLMIANAAVGLVFMALECVLMAMAVAPLKEKQKKGWVLLFIAWLLGILYTVVGAILTLNPLSIIGNLIFGAIWVGITAYFLFEIHGEFAHVERSKGVKAKKA